MLGRSNIIIKHGNIGKRYISGLLLLVGPLIVMDSHVWVGKKDFLPSHGRKLYVGFENHRIFIKENITQVNKTYALQTAIFRAPGIQQALQKETKISYIRRTM